MNPEFRAAILEHTAQTASGSTEEYLRSQNIPFKIFRLYEGDPLPRLDEFDLLVVCGGSMNVDEDKTYPWLTAEKNLIREAVANDKAYIGLCLGGQLLARSQGAAVKKLEYSEVGWTDVEWMGSRSIRVFQWHEDTFDLPKGAELLAKNAACPNQAYRLSPYVVAYQFHPETDLKWLKVLAVDPDLPAPGRFVQTAEDFMRETQHLETLKAFYFSQLDELISNWKNR